jgi:serine/threonine-protein kinase
MDYLDGITLADELESRARLSSDEAVNLALQLLEGLAAAHAEGIIHRDIKPENLILTRRPNGASHLNIVDFGMSKFLHPRPEEGSLTGAAMMLGTPPYMAPEQFADAKTADERADLWAVGTVLYEMLTGELPFSAPTLLELMSRMNAPPTPPRQLEPSIPSDLEDVVLRCLQRDRRLRFQTAEELSEALSAFARRPATGRQVTGPELPSTLPPPSPPSAPQLPAPAPQGPFSAADPNRAPPVTDGGTMRLSREFLQEVTRGPDAREAARARARRRGLQIALSLMALIVVAGLAWASHSGALSTLLARARSPRFW